MAQQTVTTIPWGIGGQSVASAASVTTDAIIGSAVTVGRGAFWVVVTVSGYTGGTGFDLINISLDANTMAATTTWAKIGGVVIGDTTAIGETLTSLTNYKIGVFNESDYQVRAYSYVQGSATAATVTIDVYPMETANG